MYHIAEDERSRRSAKKAYEALLTLSKRKGYQDISVVDVVKEAKIGRSTYYRNFDNNLDVLSYGVDSILEEGLKTVGGKEREEGLLSFIRMWLRQKELLEIIVDSSLYQVLIDAHLRLGEGIEESFFAGRKLSKTEIDCLTSILSFLLPSALRFCSLHRELEEGELLKELRKGLKGTEAILFPQERHGG